MTPVAQDLVVFCILLRCTVYLPNAVNYLID